MNSWQKLLQKYDYEIIFSTPPCPQLEEDYFKNKIEHGIINISIPKTASRCIREFLTLYSGCEYVHKHYQMMPHVIDGVLVGISNRHPPPHEFSRQSKKLRIMVIRNPFDLLVSYWSHGPKGVQGMRHEWAAEDNFENWINRFHLEWPNEYFRKFLFYHPFDKTGKCHADIAIKMEFMEEAFTQILAGHRYHRDPRCQSGPVHIPWNKWSGKRDKDFRLYYDDRTRLLVESFNRRELQLFGYQFDQVRLDRQTPYMFDMRNIRYNPVTDSLG